MQPARRDVVFGDDGIDRRDVVFGDDGIDRRDVVFRDDGIDRRDVVFGDDNIDAVSWTSHRPGSANKITACQARCRVRRRPY